MANEKKMQSEKVLNNAPGMGMNELDEIDESNDERMMETINALSGQTLYNK